MNATRAAIPVAAERKFWTVNPFITSPPESFASPDQPAAGQEKNQNQGDKK